MQQSCLWAVSPRRQGQSVNAGRTLDLHALRHTCGTRLVASGADIKNVQAIMRHSTAALTLGVYVHKDKGHMAAAVAALPELIPATLNAPKTALAKTGTDDRDNNPEGPKRGGRSPSNRQGVSSGSRNVSAGQRMQVADAQTLNHRVEGSSPSRNATFHKQTQAVILPLLNFLQDFCCVMLYGRASLFDALEITGLMGNSASVAKGHYIALCAEEASRRWPLKWA